MEGEISGLGYPGAALFSYGVALFSFNMLSLLRAAMRAVQGGEHIVRCFLELAATWNREARDKAAFGVH